MMFARTILTRVLAVVGLAVCAVATFQLGRLHAGCGTPAVHEVTSTSTVYFDGALFYKAQSGAIGRCITVENLGGGPGWCTHDEQSPVLESSLGSVSGCSFPDYFWVATNQQGTPTSEVILLCSNSDC
jgi:hypothetical protein